jgi:hypothetical protein
MKKKILLAIVILTVSCSPDENKNVGDIPFDKEMDDDSFQVCNEQYIKQYYVRYSSDTPPGYKGEKRGLENAIKNKYQMENSEGEDGYLTIRFIVNCKGKTGRYRIEEMDFAYKPKKFDRKISSQLLGIVKNLNEWTPRKDKNTVYDFYQYLTFKINDGQIVKILP